MSTKNDYWTKAVAEQGLTAFNQRRQQNPYDSTDWQQSANWILDNPYAATAPTDGYQQFQQLSGMNDPTNYAISYGRTSGGKYAGYKTSGDLWNAVEGSAILQQQEDRAKAQAMSQLLNDQLDQIQTDYTKNTRTIPSLNDQWGLAKNWANHAQPQDVQIHDGGLARAHMPREAGQDPSKAPWMQLNSQDVERNKMMNLWLAQASDPYMTGLDTMGQIQQTPIHDYKIQAGMRLGIDPALVQGRFDPQTQVSDFLTNRNLEAINNYGSTYSDYNAALSDIQRQADSQNQDAVKQQQIQVENFVADTTGKDPRSVADDSNMTIEQVAVKLQDTNYLKAAPLVQQAALAGDTEQLHQLLDPLREVDDQLWRLLQVQYSEYLPSDWDPNG
jgi:hypothetical protein